MEIKDFSFFTEKCKRWNKTGGRTRFSSHNVPWNVSHSPVPRAESRFFRVWALRVSLEKTAEWAADGPRERLLGCSFFCFVFFEQAKKMKRMPLSFFRLSSITWTKGQNFNKGIFSYCTNPFPGSSGQAGWWHICRLELFLLPCPETWAAWPSGEWSVVFKIVL